MKVIKPVIFSPSQLVSSTAVEVNPAYSPTTTYAKDALVDYGTYIYMSLQNSNLNKQPDTSPTFWQKIGPDNTHAMFDNQVSTQTTSNSPLTVTVAPGTVINSLAFLDLQGNSLQVTVRNGAGGPIVYDTGIIPLDNTVLLDWYMYFFEPFDPKTEVVLTDIPVYLNSRVTMTLSGTSSVKIGSFIYGNVYSLGGTEYGVSSGIKDYSVKQTDDFGNTTFVQRSFSKRLEAQVFMENSRLNFNQRLLSSLRATPCVWIGSESGQYSLLTVFGYYRDFNIDIAYPNHSLCRLEIEGLI